MEVKIFKAKFNQHKDARRTIEECAFPADFKIPFPVRQMRVIHVSEKAFKEKQVIGNHYHIDEKWEFCFVVGFFEFAFRFKEGSAVKKVVKTGDICLIPPGWTHAFLPLVQGCHIWGLSNFSYKEDQTKKDAIL